MNEKQTTEQLAIAVRIDIDAFEKYATQADTLLRSCVNVNPTPKGNP